LTVLPNPGELFARFDSEHKGVNGIVVYLSLRAADDRVPKTGSPDSFETMGCSPHFFSRPKDTVTRFHGIKSRLDRVSPDRRMGQRIALRNPHNGSNFERKRVSHEYITVIRLRQRCAFANG
jgi:hypothetical protein